MGCCSSSPGVRAGENESFILGPGPTSSRVHGDLEMALWEAWSGAKDQDEEEGPPALNCVMRNAVSQGFGDFALWLVLSLETSLFKIPRT